LDDSVFYTVICVKFFLNVAGQKLLKLANAAGSYSHKKSPANAKGNAQQRCMFESPVSSHILATMFLLQSPESAKRPAVNYI